MKPCNEWQEYRNSKGYGQTSVKDASRKSGWRTVYVHRLTWERANGQIPPGMCVCHRCDNPACYEMEHLFLGTVADNNADKIAKGRGVRLSGERSGSNKLTALQVMAIRSAYERGATQCGLAKEHGLAERHVWDLVHRRKWRHIP